MIQSKMPYGQKWGKRGVMSFPLVSFKYIGFRKEAHLITHSLNFKLNSF